MNFAWDLAVVRIIGVSVIAGCPQGARELTVEGFVIMSKKDVRLNSMKNCVDS